MVDESDEFAALLVLFNDWMREVDRLRRQWDSIPWWKRNERNMVKDLWDNALKTANEVSNQLVDAYIEKYGPDPRIKRT